MKRTSLTALAAVVAGLAFFATSRSTLAVDPPAAPGAGSVADSVHNLNIAYGASIVNTAWGTNQVCLPCHTPHQMPAANVSENLGKLWNHTLKPASSYTLYGTGTSYLSSIDETSRKCLGCHDGTIAVDSYGSTPNANSLTGTMSSNPATAGFVIGANGNLQHDHPIDVLYNSGSRYVGVSTLNANGSYTYTTTWSGSNNDPSSFTINGYTSVKWGPKTYTRQAISAVSFYRPSNTNQSVTVKDANPGTGTGSTVAPTANADGTFTHTISVQSSYIYCRSCHDPHNNAYHFMRVPNDNSQLCLTCHNK